MAEMANEKGDMVGLNGAKICTNGVPGTLSRGPIVNSKAISPFAASTVPLLHAKIHVVSTLEKSRMAEWRAGWRILHPLHPGFYLAVMHFMWHIFAPLSPKILHYSVPLGCNSSWRAHCSK